MPWKESVAMEERLRFVRDAQRLAEKSRRAETERRTGAIGTLVKDPKTGEYRVKREDE